MSDRTLSIMSTLFMTSLLMISGFWFCYNLFAPIPTLSPLFAQMIVNWDGPRLFINLMTGTELGRHWIDIPGIPLLIITTYAMVQLIRNRWTLPEEIWNFLFGGILIGTVIGAIWQIGGHIAGFGVIILGYGGLMLIALLRGLVRFIQLWIKKGDTTALDLYRDFFLFTLLTMPMSFVYLVAIVGGGLYGYFILLVYLSVIAILFFLARGTWVGFTYLKRSPPAWHRA